MPCHAATAAGTISAAEKMGKGSAPHRHPPDLTISAGVTVVKSSVVWSVVAVGLLLVIGGVLLAMELLPNRRAAFYPQNVYVVLMRTPTRSGFYVSSVTMIVDADEVPENASGSSWSGHPFRLHIDGDVVRLDELSPERMPALGAVEGRSLGSWSVKGEDMTLFVDFLENGLLDVSVATNRTAATGSDLGFSWQDQPRAELPMTWDDMIDYFGEPDRVERSLQIP